MHRKYDPLGVTNGPRVREHFGSESLRIAEAYQNACGAEGSSQNMVGSRKVQRNAVAPRFRPLSVLKREIYALACYVDCQRGLVTLTNHLAKRDEKWGIIHRPRQRTVIDWTIRLIRGRLLGEPPALKMERPPFLFDDTTQSRLGIELNFAFRNELRSEFVTMFIDELGGHEIISAHLAAGTYNFKNEKWLTRLQQDIPNWRRGNDDDDDDDDDAWDEIDSGLTS